MINIDKYKVVSFDLFDTLIKRDVKKPTDVFKIVELELLKRYNKSNFSIDRRNAEVNLYSKKKYEEITLDEIYSNFPDTYSKEMLDDYKNMELKIEYDVCNFNEKIRDFYEMVYHSNRTILIITDIYLPKNFIIEVLKKNNINFDYLFVSSEERLKKKTGNLFRHALKSLNLNVNDILHIGDNAVSDYKIPKLLGMDAYKMDTIVNHSQYNDIKTKNASFEYDILASFINNRLPRYHNHLKQIGYECLGPLLYGFSNWLYERCSENRLDKILFLSRDGQLMQKAFNVFDKEKKFSSKYFYASRRALIVPNLKNCKSISEMFELFTFPKYLSISNIVKKMGLSTDISEINSLIIKYDINKEEKFYFKNYNSLSENIKKFLDEIYPIIVENSKKEYVNEINYLKKNICQDDKNIAIVDIGWYGNMQKNLEKTLNEIGEYNIYGYYVGLVPKYSNKNNLKMEGYLFNTSDKSFETYIKEKNFNSLFELMFSADHGTVIKYENNEAVLAKYEYSSSELNNIKLIQSGALEFVQDICHTTYLKNIFFDEKVISRNIFNLGNNPTFYDAKLIGDFLFLDNSLSKISNYNIPYHFNIKKIYSDFKMSQWKIAFLRLLLRINLPYEKICRLLRGNNVR